MKLVAEKWEVRSILSCYDNLPNIVMSDWRLQYKEMKTTFLAGVALSACQQWEVGGGLLWRREHQAGGSASPEEQQPGEISARDCSLHQ